MSSNPNDTANDAYNKLFGYSNMSSSAGGGDLFNGFGQAGLTISGGGGTVSPRGLRPGIQQHYNQVYQPLPETVYGQPFDEELYNKVKSLVELLTNDPDVPVEKLSEVI